MAVLDSGKGTGLWVLSPLGQWVVILSTQCRPRLGDNVLLLSSLIHPTGSSSFCLSCCLLPLPLRMSSWQPPCPSCCTPCRWLNLVLGWMMLRGHFGAGIEAAPLSMGLPDCQPGLLLTGAFCLPRLSLPPPEPSSQGPASDLEIWQAESAGEYGAPGALPNIGLSRDLATEQVF